MAEHMDTNLGSEHYRPDIPCSDDEFESLPERNIEAARLLYGGLANSDNPNDREYVAYRLAELTRADHDFGLVLWHSLITDDHLGVMESAFDTLVCGLADLDICIRDTGLSWGDIRSLIYANRYELKRRVEAASLATKPSNVVPLPADLLTDK